MGRRAVLRERQDITPRVRLWLEQLFARIQDEDLAQMTIDDMAQLAGKSKSTIYQYFSSKEDIMEAACRHRVDAIMQSLHPIIREETNTVQQYKDLVEVFAKNTADMSIAFLQGVKEYFPSAWSVINDFTDQFIILLQAQYTKGISENLYNPISVELLGQMDKLFVSHVVSNPSLFSDNDYKLDDLIRDYLNLRLMGLLKR